MKILILTFLTMFSFCAFGADEDIGKEGVEGPAKVELISIWQMLIPIVVPLIIAGIKGIIPKLPTRLTPWLAPILGAIIDVILNLTGLGEGIGPTGAALGLSGIGVREILNQATKPQAIPPITKRIIPLLLLLALIPGCARFGTKQTDISYEEGKPQRAITTKASAFTFFSAKSALTNWKASQTDKTQGATVGALNQETDAALQLVPVFQALIEAAQKAKTPVP